MTILTGDTHRDFKRVGALCDKLQTITADTLIILGDAGINYFGRAKDWAFNKPLHSRYAPDLSHFHRPTGRHRQR